MQKSKFSDWVGSDNDEYYYQDSRARGGRKNKKKKNKNHERMWDWDDVYDPTQPNVYGDYKRSEEQTREIRDWKARLYYHQLKGSKKAGSNRTGHSDSETEQKSRPINSMIDVSQRKHSADVRVVTFAPPTAMSFAPPTFDDAPARPPMEDDDDYYPPANHGPQHTRSSGTPPSFAAAPVPNDATGEDAYARRMRMSSNVAPSPPTRARSTPTPPPAPANGMTEAEIAAKKAEAQAKIAAFKAKLQKPPPKPSSTSPGPTASSVANPPALVANANASVPSPPPPPPPPPPATSGSTISRAPVRYEVPRPLTENVDTPMPDADDNSANDNQPRSNRPGKKGFAERLLKKYGWEKGHGLGAQGEGITTALFMKADKRKKRTNEPDGGRGAPLPNMGKIVGGKKRKIEGEGFESESVDPRYGKMSEVVKLESMLDGLDVQHEIEENNLMQEIGEHMGGTYGNVERVFIWREAMGGMNEVFVKFTSPLSAMNAVNGMAGTEFAGNEVKAKFWEAERFEKGEYA